MCSINKYDTCDATSTFRCKNPHRETANRGSDQNRRFRDARPLEKNREVVRESAGRARRWSGIAIARPRSVIGARPCESGDLGLDNPSDGAGPAQPGLQNDSRCPLIRHTRYAVGGHPHL